LDRAQVVKTLRMLLQACEQKHGQNENSLHFYHFNSQILGFRCSFSENLAAIQKNCE
jgi:hypothetical protein